jgi:hypothetical protein
VIAGSGRPQVAADKEFDPQILSDSLYNALHPGLLFDAGDIPTLYNKVRDGGYDDDAYDFIRLLVDYIYPGRTEEEMLGGDFGMAAMPIMGLATFLESPADETTRAMGLAVTLYLANNYGVDRDEYNSALRLRSLALGYDFFMKNATEAERNLVRTEIIAYVDTMTTGFGYMLRAYRPYMSNKTAMVAAALGLAAIVLHGEIDPEWVSDTLTHAEWLLEGWKGYLIDTDGAYAEGVLYAAWSMKNLVYYFAARDRFDGLNHAAGKIQKMENWLVYELLPTGDGKSNNLNDSSWGDDPLPRHHTYFDWAQSEWNSGLSAWMYEHVAGPYGWDWGEKADKPATVLWNRNLAPSQPDSVLPPGYVWEERGLYYGRSGWQSGAASDDVVFSFFSGMFRGGHAQEDQNHFTLYGYGAAFVMDHGPGNPARQSESHNIVFVDGAGQHNAGSSIGTDGELTSYVLGRFSDFVQGDATKAYATYSPLNNPKYPFAYSDWSWGYAGSNPVLHAIRSVVAVHGDGSVPPYFLIVDDIDKDGGTHDYQWRMHTPDQNTVDTTGGGTSIQAPTGRLDVHALHPAPESMFLTVTPYNNLTDEPDSKLLVFETSAINPWFTFLLLPGDYATAEPALTRQQFSWGFQATLSWGTCTDVLVLNHSGAPVEVTVTGMPAPPASGVSRTNTATAALETDATITVLRYDGVVVSRFVAAEATSLVVDGVQLLAVLDGAATVVHSGSAIGLDRIDADFQIYGPGVTEIRYRSQPIHFINNAGYLTPDPVSGPASVELPRAPLRARAYPNPFNPSTTVEFELSGRSHVSAVVYDALGRPVRMIADKVFPAGHNEILWDGRGNKGLRVPSGVYFVRISSDTGRATVKLTVVK